MKKSKDMESLTTDHIPTNIVKNLAKTYVDCIFDRKSKIIINFFYSSGGAVR